MSKEDQFFIYLLEHYAASVGQPAGEVLARWDALGLTDYIHGMYELYHCEAIENAFDDIDARMEQATATA